MHMSLSREHASRPGPFRENPGVFEREKGHRTQATLSILLGENAADSKIRSIHFENEGFIGGRDRKDDVVQEGTLEGLKGGTHGIVPNDPAVGLGASLKLFTQGMSKGREIAHIGGIILGQPEKTSEMGDSFDHVGRPFVESLEFAGSSRTKTVEKNVTTKFNHQHEKGDLRAFGGDLVMPEGRQNIGEVQKMIAQ